MCYLKHDEIPPPPKDLTPSPQKKPSGGFKKCVIPHNFYRLEEFLYKNALFRTIFLYQTKSCREKTKMRYFT